MKSNETREKGIVHLENPKANTDTTQSRESNTNQNSSFYLFHDSCKRAKSKGLADSMSEELLCPLYSGFFGHAGVTLSMVLCSLGAAIGTAKSGAALGGLATVQPGLVMKSLIPVVMASILAIYGLVIAVLISGSLHKLPYSLFAGSVHLGSGLMVGGSCLAAGYAIGEVGMSGIKGFSQQPRLFIGMVLILIFAEVLGLYGLIVSLIMNGRASEGSKCQ